MQRFMLGFFAVSTLLFAGAGLLPAATVEAEVSAFGCDKNDPGTGSLAGTLVCTSTTGGTVSDQFSLGDNELSQNIVESGRLAGYGFAEALFFDNLTVTGVAGTQVLLGANLSYDSNWTWNTPTSVPECFGTTIEANLGNVTTDITDSIPLTDKDSYSQSVPNAPLNPNNITIGASGNAPVSFSLVMATAGACGAFDGTLQGSFDDPISFTALDPQTGSPIDGVSVVGSDGYAYAVNVSSVPQPGSGVLLVIAAAIAAILRQRGMKAGKIASGEYP